MVYALIIAQIICAWLYSHFLEYVLHRYVLHNIKIFDGRAFKFHFKEHHRNSRNNAMIDDQYHDLLRIIKHPELFSLLILSILHLPIAFFFPWAYLTLVYSAIAYYFIHLKAHYDSQWGRKWLPWHYDHHMGSDQQTNWGVRLPLFDLILGTRFKYKNTFRETQDIINHMQNHPLL